MFVLGFVKRYLLCFKYSFGSAQYGARYAFRQAVYLRSYLVFVCQAFNRLEVLLCP